MFRTIGRLKYGATCSAACLHALMYAMPASADTWQIDTSAQVPLQVLKAVGNLEGNKIYVDNSKGAALLRIPAQQASNMRFAYAFNTPYVFAKYSPDNAAGTISVMKLERLPNGDVLAVQRRISPQNDGAAFASKYGMDPFSPFTGGAGGAFIHIQPNAFWTAVGLVMQKYQSSNGYIAVADTRTDVTTSTSGNWLRKHTTTTLTAYTRPVWVMAVPSGVGTGIPQSYALPNGKVVQAGVNFINQGVGSNMPMAEYVSFQHSETQSSWTMFAKIVFSSMVLGVSGGVGVFAVPAILAAGNGSIDPQTGYMTNFAVNALLTTGINPGNLQVAPGVASTDPSAQTSPWDYRATLYNSLVQSSEAGSPGDFGVGYAMNKLAPGSLAPSPTLESGAGVSSPDSSGTGLGIGSLAPSL